MRDRIWDVTEKRWPEILTAVAAVAGLIITLLAGGYTIISRIDSLAYHIEGVDNKLTELSNNLNKENERQDKAIDDHEKRLRALEQLRR